MSKDKKKSFLFLNIMNIGNNFQDKKTPRECLKDKNCPPECLALQNTFFECKRSLVSVNNKN